MKDSNAADVKAWSDAIRQSGRPMVLDVTQGHLTIAIAPTVMKYANQWEFAPDVECYDCEKGGSSYPLTRWAEIAKRFNYVAEWQPYAGPGAFNDYDSIEVGNGSDDGLTPLERQTQISLWALGAAPSSSASILLTSTKRICRNTYRTPKSWLSTRIRSPRKECSIPATNRCSQRGNRPATRSSVCSTPAGRQRKSPFQHPP